MTVATNFSPKVSSVLERFPYWKKKVLEAIGKPIVSPDFKPNVTEIYDDLGLMVVKTYDRAYQTTRPKEHKSEFCAWLWDNELLVFYVGSEVVINRKTKENNSQHENNSQYDGKVSLKSLSVLNKYPQWRERVFQAMDKPKLSSDFSAETFEIFDQHGVMTGRIHGHPFDTTRNSNQSSDFMAWVLDGELMFFHIQSEVLVNRIFPKNTTQS